MAELLELSGRPPELSAFDRRGEVSEVVPEPEQEVPELTHLLVEIQIGGRELEPGEYPRLVVEDTVRPRTDRSQIAFTEEEQLELNPVGKDYERDVSFPKSSRNKGRPRRRTNPSFSAISSPYEASTTMTEMS